MIIDDVFTPIRPKDRLMLLVHHLKFKRRKTVKEHALILGVDERTVYRYLQNLEYNYIIDKDEYNRYFIHTDAGDDEITVSLTAEEMQLLQQLVTNSRSKFREGLVNKLDRNLGLMFTDEGNYAAIIDLLLTAINNKRKVVLQNYTPGSSQTPQIRHIEPIAITELKYLTAFDTKAKKNKVYSIFRIGKVTILDEAQEFENDHKHVKPDIFGMTTGKAYPLKLKLSPRACLLMKEEFPRSVEFLRKTGDSKHPYIFDGYVYALEGVGRFVMGLLHETVIEQPIELKEYIAEKISDYNSSDKF